MKVKDRKELYGYLDKEVNDSCYAIVNNVPTYFWKYKDSYFESPCQLMWCLADSELDLKYAFEYGYEYVVGKVAYCVENFQCIPYLEKDIEIEIISERNVFELLYLKENINEF